MCVQSAALNSCKSLRTLLCLLAASVLPDASSQFSEAQPGQFSRNPGVAKGIGLWRISKLLKQGHFGVFEVNNAWIAANQPQAGRLDLKDRMIPMPYVVNAATFRGDHREVHTHEISVFLC